MTVAISVKQQRPIAAPKLVRKDTATMAAPDKTNPNTIAIFDPEIEYLVLAIDASPFNYLLSYQVILQIADLK